MQTWMVEERERVREVVRVVVTEKLVVGVPVVDRVGEPDVQGVGE